jgi:hypothetical protein
VKPPVLDPSIENARLPHKQGFFEWPTIRAPGASPQSAYPVEYSDSQGYPDSSTAGYRGEFGGAALSLLGGFAGIMLLENIIDHHHGFGGGEYRGGFDGLGGGGWF